jgi:uncharacterized protein (DUF488 family)
LSEEAFFGKLHAAGVDYFCDIRARRGVRGREYAFVNSRRLQAHLAEMGIPYVHLKDLAPTAVIRQTQALADKADKTAKRQRTALGDAFIHAYQQQILAPFSAEVWLESLPQEVRAVLFFCVEHAPEACHRSLVAQRFAELGLKVEHL